ncbi:MAG: hypothetical protein ABIT16_04740 [Croceibacterium sp.]
MSLPLAARVAAAVDRSLDPAVAGIARELGEETKALAVLFYGSNLRTGSLEGVLDFYVLLPGPRETGIWPHVSYREWDRAGHGLRAKIATMNLATFAKAAAGETLDTTIWARFVQPCAIAWARDTAAQQSVLEALAAAAFTAARLAVTVGPERGSEDDYWRALFRATYRAELRVEPPGREESILSANRAHFDGLLPAALSHGGIPFGQDQTTIEPRLELAERRRTQRWWARRRRVGKLLNAVRLVRATTTFEGGMRYVAWKVERHTGVPVKVTPLREKMPILAVPSLAWHLWRSRKGPIAPGK